MCQSCDDDNNYWNIRTSYNNSLYFFKTAKSDKDLESKLANEAAKLRHLGIDISYENPDQFLNDLREMYESNKDYLYKS